MPPPSCLVAMLPSVSERITLDHRYLPLFTQRIVIFYVYVPKTNPKSQWETIPKVKTFLMGVFRWARGQFHSQRHVVCFAMQRPRQIVPCGSLVDGPGLPTAPSGLNGGGLFCVAALHD